MSGKQKVREGERQTAKWERGRGEEVEEEKKGVKQSAQGKIYTTSLSL